jgi:hypothetical protein
LQKITENGRTNHGQTILPRKDGIMEWLKSAKQVLFVIEDQFDEEKGFVVFSAIEGVRGFLATNEHYGFDYDFAVWYANQKNTLLGIDATTASRIIANATKDNGAANRLPI